MREKPPYCPGGNVGLILAAEWMGIMGRQLFCPICGRIYALSRIGATKNPTMKIATMRRHRLSAALWEQEPDPSLAVEEIPRAVS